MQLPLINMNGTSATSLLETGQAAIDAARALREALTGMAIHGRDYYPLGNEAVVRALNEHRLRCSAVDAVIADLTTYCEHVVKSVK
jgi:hypothetical protein